MITPETTLRGVFEFLDREENAVQVVPMTIKQQEDDTQLAIFLHGEHEATSVIMAELMTRIGELFDMQAQAEATVESESRIITG
jgi:predicted transcriptional regulator